MRMILILADSLAFVHKHLTAPLARSRFLSLCKKGFAEFTEARCLPWLSRPTYGQTYEMGSLTIILIHGRNAWPERGMGPSGERGGYRKPAWRRPSLPNRRPKSVTTNAQRAVADPDRVAATASVAPLGSQPCNGASQCRSHVRSIP